MQAIRSSVPHVILKFKIGKLNVELDSDFICIAKGFFEIMDLRFGLLVGFIILWHFIKLHSDV